MVGPSRFAKCVLVIPARRQSTRLPEKLLLRDTGKTGLEHTFSAACEASSPDGVLIATDDDKIASEARRFGAVVVMTSPDCRSGTDRVAEAIASQSDAQIIVNLQIIVFEGRILFRIQHLKQS